MIEQSSIEQLKNQLDIVDVISNYIELKKNGANYKALCPFHTEDTPSFVVSPAKQIFHCFGCGVGGDAIKFVMEYEKLSYPEAIEKLASMYNFSLTYTKNQKEVTNLYKVLATINTFYKQKLLQTPKALEYLKNRGVSQTSIEKFELGYAPNSAEQLIFLQKNHIPLPQALEAGILAQDSRIYARMVERITFPIFSAQGKPIGFGGRTISNHPAKYLNSPQTKLFNKSKILYGYHLAKESIYKKRQMIVCEGYLDVVMLHQAGFDTAVATLGTALTPSHLPLLRRGEPKVILAYDGDKAGIAAALKAAKLLSSHDIDGGVVIFPAGLDPADMVKKTQIKELENLFKSPKPFVPFALEAIVGSFDIKNIKEKEKALTEGVAYLKTLSPLMQEEYKDYLAALLEILPSQIPLGKQKSFTKLKDTFKDPKELSVIKTMLLKPHLIETILDIIDKEHFFYHKEEFILAVNGQKEHPKLREILLDEDILPLDEANIKDELLVFLIKYYEKKIKELVKANIPLHQKSFLIRKYRHNILKLKRGELVIEED